MGKRIGYLRVSTRDQSEDRQIDGLEAHCDELFVEKVSAVSRHRPVYQAVVRNLRRGDSLIVHSLDRAYRSTLDALNEVQKLRERGIEFVIVTMRIDTSDPYGEFLFTMLSALAQLERQILSKRTKDGIAAARKRGKKWGRPRKLTKRKLQKARQLLGEPGATRESVAKVFDVAPWTLTRSLRRAES